MKKGKRVILIGFDAGILRTVDHFINELPNFKRLIQEGVSSEARPSMPVAADFICPDFAELKCPPFAARQ